MLLEGTQCSGDYFLKEKDLCQTHCARCDLPKCMGPMLSH